MTTAAATADTKLIARQILGRQGARMIGAHTFLDHGNALSFKFKAGRKYDYCKITLLADDTYTIEIGKIIRYELRKVEKSEGVFAEQLRPFFERITGLYLTL